METQTGERNLGAVQCKTDRTYHALGEGDMRLPQTNRIPWGCEVRAGFRSEVSRGVRRGKEMNRINEKAVIWEICCEMEKLGMELILRESEIQEYKSWVAIREATRKGYKKEIE